MYCCALSSDPSRSCGVLGISCTGAFFASPDYVPTDIANAIDVTVVPFDSFYSRKALPPPVDDAPTHNETLESNSQREKLRPARFGPRSAHPSPSVHIPGSTASPLLDLPSPTIDGATLENDTNLGSTGRSENGSPPVSHGGGAAVTAGISPAAAAEKIAGMCEFCPCSDCSG